MFVVTNAIEPRSYYRRVADSKGGAKVSEDQGKKERPSTGARVLERGRHIFSGVVLVFRTPSFLLILLGNIIGTIVAGNMGYKIMYLQVTVPPVAMSPHLAGMWDVQVPRPAANTAPFVGWPR